MRDVPRIEGTPDPRRTSQVKSDEEIDPEKFKKVMKVDESDESQKRNKRNRAEQEDELDEEDETSESSAPAPGFSALMDETENRDSVFQTGSGTQTAAPSEESDETGPPGTSPFTMMAKDRTKEPEVPNSPSGLFVSSGSSDNINFDDPAEMKKHQRKVVKETQKKTKKILTKAIKVAKEIKTTKSKKGKKTTTPVPKPLIEASEKPLKRKDKTEELKKLAPHEIKQVQEDIRKQEVQQQMTTFEPEKKKIESHIPPAETHMIDLEKKKKQAQKSAGEDEQKQEDKKDEKKETSEVIQQIDTSMQTPDQTPQLSPYEMPSYSNLSPKVYELYEKFVGLITIQQTTGSNKTTVKLNMPGSVFNKAEIVLEKFESAPNTFNVSLAGTPEAVELFNANMADLIAAFQDNKRSFEVNIQRPYLLKEHRHIIKKVSGSDEEDKQGSEEDSNPQDRHAS